MVADGLQVAITPVSLSKSVVLRQGLERGFQNIFVNEQGRSFFETDLIEVLRNVDTAIVETEATTDRILT